MAAIFDSRGSTGIVVLMFIMGDIFAVVYYNQHAQWRYVVRLMPWAVAGILLGVVVGKQISDDGFRTLLAIVILLALVVMVVQEIRGGTTKVPETWWISAILGLAGGFASMVGNAAAPIMSMYLLSMKLPKNAFIGTGAWFYFVLNLVKVPFHIFYWQTITVQTGLLNITMIPMILGGVMAGIVAIRYIPEKPYRIIIIGATAAAAIRLML